MRTLNFNRFLYRGFSLVELLVAIAIAAILMALAAPSFSSFIDNQRLQTATLEFYAGVNLARAEAIKRGAQVSMVATDGSDWKSGWTIFVDDNGNLKADSNEKIIFTHDALSSKFTVTSAFTDSSSAYISYTGNGRSRTKASVQQPQAGTVSFIYNSVTRRVKLNFLGRARTCNPDKDATCDASATGG
ncbi:GspH/FimT family pseudopilin [Undibacterium rugosum]|uniref:GspH/FimT family pseudopilin n=1 Tax=Undibacterium rugosum TaxID=2762291 RepID=UPI001E54C272|nr:GspH/FimT family pseudopilin [Undibacterium rugosum]